MKKILTFSIWITISQILSAQTPPPSISTQKGFEIGVDLMGLRNKFRYFRTTEGYDRVPNFFPTFNLFGRYTFNSSNRQAWAVRSFLGLNKELTKDVAVFDYTLIIVLNDITQVLA